jgi:hypothetical protein
MWLIHCERLGGEQHGGADGRVVAFESEGALVAEDSEFPVDVFVHDEQP